MLIDETPHENVTDRFKGLFLNMYLFVSETETYIFNKEGDAFDVSV